MVKAGDAAAGTAQLEEAVAWFERSNLRYTRSTWALRLAEGYLQLGERAKARILVEEILAAGREGGYRHLEGVALRLLGEVLAQDEPTRAAQHLEAAMQTLEAIDARDEVGKTLLGRAELLRAAGDIAGARACLERAVTIFQALGTRDDLGRAQERLVDLARPPVV